MVNSTHFGRIGGLLLFSPKITLQRVRNNLPWY